MTPQRNTKRAKSRFLGPALPRQDVEPLTMKTYSHRRVPDFAR